MRPPADTRAGTQVAVFVGVGSLAVGFVGLAWLLGGVANAVYALLVLATLAFVSLLGFRIVVTA